MSTEPLTALASALRERRAVVADREFYRRDPAAHLAQLQSVSERIEQLGESFRRIGQNRATFVNAVKGQDGAQSRSSVEAFGVPDHTYVFKVTLEVVLRCV